MTRIAAKTTAEIADAVRSGSSLRISGSDSGREWRRPVEADSELSIVSRGILEHDVDDQVVVVSAGATIREVQCGLAAKGQCLPLGLNFPDAALRLEEADGTIGGRLSLNLPHSFQYSCGSWRDWVLGLTIVRADGTVAKCGSKAVKNVAGYDVAKLFVGARGTLGVVSEVILRTYPLKALPEPDVALSGRLWAARGWLQKVLPADFSLAAEKYGPCVLASNPRGCVLYVEGGLHRFDEDWVVGWGIGEENIRIEDPALAALMNRTKAVLDGGGKLNPGEFI